MTTIRKKVWPEHFSAVSSGAKPFEVRLADEQVQVGDTLVLEEWSPEAGYTGRSIERKVCSVLPLRDLPYWPREQVEAVGLQVIGFEVAPALAREVQRLQGEVERLRPRPSFCLECLYDLAGSDCCPECGAEVQDSGALEVSHGE